MRTAGPRERCGSAEARFEVVTAAVWRGLPGLLQRWVPQTFIGFVAINGFTFGLDLALLMVLDEQLGVPHPVAFSVGYGVAFSLAFVLNRWLNCHVHGHMGEQVGGGTPSSWRSTTRC